MFALFSKCYYALCVHDEALHTVLHQNVMQIQAAQTRSTTTKSDYTFQVTRCACNCFAVAPRVSIIYYVFAHSSCFGLNSFLSVNGVSMTSTGSDTWPSVIMGSLRLS